MIGAILIGLGVLLIALSRILPHRNPVRVGQWLARALGQWLARALAWRTQRARYKLHLPTQMTFMWQCSIELEKLPLVVGELNRITLTASPWSGDPDAAHIEVPIESSTDLKSVAVTYSSARLDIEEASSRLELSLAEPRSCCYSAIPTEGGDSRIEFFFHQQGKPRGFIEAYYKVKSRQHGCVLPAGVAAALSILGVLLSLAGVALTVSRAFR